MWRFSCILVFVAAWPMQAEIVDRVVAVADGQPIKHSDVVREIRLAAFMNHESPRFTSEAQNNAVNRLIDQLIIRKEMNEIAQPDQGVASADQLLEPLTRSYGSAAELSTHLAASGITRQELIKQLEWQVAVLQFIDFRFGTREAPSSSAGAPTNDDFFAWLDSVRQQMRIEVKEDRLK